MGSKEGQQESPLLVINCISIFNSLRGSRLLKRNILLHLEVDTSGCDMLI